MKNFYISIVSHGNEDDIINNRNLKGINSLDNATVIIRDNLSNDNLRIYCGKNDFQYSSSNFILGFGANNNINYKLASDLGMRESDWFILFNPDVDMSPTMFNRLSNTIDDRNSKIFAINLFFDKELSDMEYSLRKFPTLSSFFNIVKGSSFTQAYNKTDLADGSFVDWAAGSFLVFQSDLYGKLGGFDENYFMYFEDVDICFRATNLYNQHVVYLSEIKAVHKGAYKNRRLFSKHFRWYFTSLLRFLFITTFRYRE
ncbi:glycosyltransferase [Paraglaciecola sp. 20A4]|uniref:glycosyltransferase n=1 Tax=Paraglaciecola sp. 20A4 TaxID=2687288 RepID=UPI00140E3B14|nr:glycosyltransferase [Paraglaciecola sp. 20A4]